MDGLTINESISLLFERGDSTRLVCIGSPRNAESRSEKELPRYLVSQVIMHDRKFQIECEQITAATITNFALRQEPSSRKKPKTSSPKIQLADHTIVGVKKKGWNREWFKRDLISPTDWKSFPNLNDLILVRCLLRRLPLLNTPKIPPVEALMLQDCWALPSCDSLSDWTIKESRCLIKLHLVNCNFPLVFNPNAKLTNLRELTIDGHKIPQQSGKFTRLSDGNFVHFVPSLREVSLRRLNVGLQTIDKLPNTLLELDVRGSSISTIEMDKDEVEGRFPHASLMGIVYKPDSPSKQMEKLQESIIGQPMAVHELSELMQDITDDNIDENSESSSFNKIEISNIVSALVESLDSQTAELVAAEVGRQLRSPEGGTLIGMGVRKAVEQLKPVVEKLAARSKHSPHESSRQQKSTSSKRSKTAKSKRKGKEKASVSKQQKRKGKVKQVFAKPRQILFFGGPPGTGKTHAATTFATVARRPYFVYDMKTYNRETSIKSLMGADPEYVGFGETMTLPQRVIKHPNIVLIFNDMDKAHESVREAFDSVFSEGRLHDVVSDKYANFRNTVIIMTSNCGQEEVCQLPWDRPYGRELALQHQAKRAVKRAVEASSNWSWTSRVLNGIVPFVPHTLNTYIRVLETKADSSDDPLCPHMVAKACNMNVYIFRSVIQEFALKNKHDKRFGIRPCVDSFNQQMSRLIKGKKGKFRCADIKLIENEIKIVNQPFPKTSRNEDAVINDMLA